MQRLSVLIVLLAAASLITAATAPEATAPVAPAFSIVVDVHPSSREPYQLLRRPTPSTYNCDAIIETVPENRSAFVHARMVAEPGRAETITQTFGDGFALKFTVKVGAQQRDANSVVEISRAGQIVARQTSRVMLQRPEKAVRPVG